MTAGVFERYQCLLLTLLKRTPVAVLPRTIRLDKRLASRFAHQRFHHSDSSRCIEHVHNRLLQLGGNLYRRMSRTGRRSADQQRNTMTLLLHRSRNPDHLVQRRSDQARQSDHVGILADGCLENLLGRHHHTQVDHIEVVAPQHDSNNVLANVVHITFDRGRDNPTAVTGHRPIRTLLLLHERSQIGHSLLHHTGTLDHLGQKHAAGSEQLANRVHPVHQRTLDHLQWPPQLLPSLLGIRHDELVDPLDQRPRQTLLHRTLPPGRHLRLATLNIRSQCLGQLQQPLGRVVPTVQQDVLDMLEQLSGDVVVNGQLSRVDDRQLHPGIHRVIQEGRVHGAADLFVATERKRYVADSTRHQRPRTRLANQPSGLEKRRRIVLVLIHPGPHRQDVGIEDDVAGRKTDHFGQQPERATGDLELSARVGRLASLVKPHHDHSRPVSSHQASLVQERRFAFLETDRVDDRLALHALQPRLDHLPIRTVDHDRHPGHIRLGRDQVQEVPHRHRAVQQGLVHVHVDHVGTAVDLLPGHRHRFIQLAVANQSSKSAAARYVGPLADHDQVAVVANRQ